MSTQGMNQFLLCTRIGAYMQAIEVMEQANSSDRLARDALRPNKHGLAVWEKPTRSASVWRFPMRRAWEAASKPVTAKTILASLMLILMLPPFIWLIV